MVSAASAAAAGQGQRSRHVRLLGAPRPEGCAAQTRGAALGATVSRADLTAQAADTESPEGRPGLHRCCSPGRRVPGLLVLFCWPISLAHHGPPLWGGPHTHGTTPRCYSAEELPPGQAPLHLLARVAKWEHALPVALVSSLEAAGRGRRQAQPQAGSQCPVLRPEDVLEAEIHQRSISPWTYRVDTDESRYPRKLAWAECLCRGCLNTLTGRKTPALNSVPLLQSLPVLRRRPCAPRPGAPAPGAVAFHTEFIRVPVGCTCVLPRSAH
ncbi:Interleukin-17C [Galemys pyrenaicus]|uniref:Interleukin-17C n=1 Tax=Galemys pyrenaicus TaxID=202257 RepID=A0A8J6AB67_GALPY|nr:Interleukin-17C [Galemys pyrenaicus]